jgi:hypothetical protein
MYSNTADRASSASSHRCWRMSSFLIVAFFSGNYLVWLPRNLPERGALRYLLHRGRERVIPGILNLPHPAGASRPGQPGANPQANTLNLRKNADHRPGVEYRTNANADDGPGLVWTALGRHRDDPACGGPGPTAPDQVPADGPGTRDPVQGQQTRQGRFRVAAPRWCRTRRRRALTPIVDSSATGEPHGI